MGSGFLSMLVFLLFFPSLSVSGSRKAEGGCNQPLLLLLLLL